jgi:hypothetical protein
VLALPSSQQTGLPCKTGKAGKTAAAFLYLLATCDHVAFKDKRTCEKVIQLAKLGKEIKN